MIQDPVYTEKALRSLLGEKEGDALFSGVVDLIRPDALESDADQSLRCLAGVLEDNPDLAEELSDRARELLGSTRLVHGLAESGIMVDKGFFASLQGRFIESVLPMPLPDQDVRKLIRKIFKSRDYLWIRASDPSRWAAVFRTLIRQDDAAGIPHEDIALAIFGLAQRAGALGIDQDVNAKLNEVEDYDSPFLDLTHEAREFVADHRDPPGDEETYEAILGTIEECRSLIEYLREHKRRYGTSMHLTAASRRLLQQLNRLELLVRLVRPEDIDDFAESITPVFVNVIEAGLASGSVRRLLQQHADLVAYQITEQTAKKGSKYITDSSTGYWAFLKKAVAGGAIVGVFAIFKLLLSELELSLAAAAILYSANYAACFVLIYLTGSILATKQPAVTASAIAQKLDNATTESSALNAVADMVVLVWRSQFISFVGNLICAFPVAIAFTLLLDYGLSVVVADADGASYLLGEIHPWTSGALFYAGVAGVFLFLAGVIAGTVDNHSTYVKLADRLKSSRWLSFLGEKRVEYAATIPDNLGMITGNALLGVFLGTAGTIGIILGLPFDIRHIAFSSANFGVAVASAPEILTWQNVAITALGVASIGFVNFVVSFGLTLAMTLESRQTSFRNWWLLVKLLFKRVIERPLAWYFPPRKGSDSDSESDGEG